MVKQKYNSKRGRISSIPKGLPIRTVTAAGGTPSTNDRSKKHSINGSLLQNPFEGQSNKRLKHEVMNRIVPGSKRNSTGETLTKAFQVRQRASNSITSSTKNNAFKDHRIGEARQHSAMTLTKDEAMLRRLVKERVSRSKRASKFDLNENTDKEIELTHRGQVIDESYYNTKKLHLSADDDNDDDDIYDATLSRADTELHFGGPSSARQTNKSTNPYGPADAAQVNIGDVHRSRKTELEEIIARSKQHKAEKAKQKDEQVNTFETMDQQFSDLAQLLAWNSNKGPKRNNSELQDEKKIEDQDEDDDEAKEMDAWNKEVKQYLFTPKVMASDRTKTPEEIATEESERLHELERRRMARMNGDFEADDLSDVDSSEDEGDGKVSRHKMRMKKEAKKKKNKKTTVRNPDELDDSGDDSEDEIQARFTADGLVYIDKKGNIVTSDGATSSNNLEKEESVDSNSNSCDEESNGSDEESNDGLGNTDDEASANDISESDDDEASANGISESDDEASANDISESDENLNGVKVVPQSSMEQGDARKLKKKKLKAKIQARGTIPFVFDVPTTLDALHDMIAIHAGTGADASLIVQRIHASNSVRLNSKNSEKMQNFYDVLLRRFLAVGDAIYRSGNGGEELARQEQLNSLTKTLYKMSHDSPECAGAVWGRRLGVLQKALAKRLRDSELVAVSEEDEEFTAWPSMGTILLLRAVGHIFPVTDFKHAVVTPCLLLLGQAIAQAPVRSIQDVIMGLLCSGAMIEYTKDSKRIAPEAISFIAGVIRLFAEDVDSASEGMPIPTLASAVKYSKIDYLREHVSQMDIESHTLPQLSLQQMDATDPSTAGSILTSALRLVNALAIKYEGGLQNAEAETFSELTNALLLLNPRCKSTPLPHAVASLVSSTAGLVARCFNLGQPRIPLLRQAGGKTSEIAVVSLAPRMEDPGRYNFAKDKNKNQQQAQHDKFRREYKREHKAVARELRLDSAFVESERRKDKLSRDTKARDKRHKNHAWMEQEQATINQQVAQGGALLRGGGIAVAKRKAASAKIGIKKGGKLR